MRKLPRIVWVMHLISAMRSLAIERRGGGGDKRLRIPVQLCAKQWWCTVLTCSEVGLELHETWDAATAAQLEDTANTLKATTVLNKITALINKSCEMEASAEEVCDGSSEERETSPVCYRRERQEQPWKRSCIYLQCCEYRSCSSS